MKEQEEMIDQISSGVQRLNDMAHTIQDEIQEHDRLIDTVEMHVDVARRRWSTTEDKWSGSCKRIVLDWKASDA